MYQASYGRDKIKLCNWDDYVWIYYVGWGVESRRKSSKSLLHIVSFSLHLSVLSVYHHVVPSSALYWFQVGRSKNRML